MDEQAGLLSAPRLPVLALALALILSASCRLTEVALVTVRNETASDLEVQVRLPGNPTFHDDRPLPPAQENALLKYEEPRSAARPMPELVDGLRLTAGACVATLDAGALAAAAERTERPRRWTVRVTPQLLRSAGCPPAAP